MDLTKVGLTKSIIVPKWIYTHLLGHGLSGENILDVSKAVEYIAPDDMALWYVINRDQEEIFGARFADYCHEVFEPVFDGDQGNALRVSTYSNELSRNAIARLSGSPVSVAGGPGALNQKSYSIINISNFVLVVIDEGFIEVTKDGALCLEFLRDYLKAHYKVTPFTTVSRLPVFRSYLESLAA